MPEPYRFNPAIAANQKRCFLRLWTELSPWVRRDSGFALRLEGCLRRERSFGSRDRRLYRELLYTAVRHLPWIEGVGPDDMIARIATWAGETPATRGFREVWARSEVLADPAFADPSVLLPDWFRDECEAAWLPNEAQCLRTRTPLWLRLQCSDSREIESEWRFRNWAWLADDAIPEAWRMDGDFDVTRTKAFESGAIEVQDLGSQMILAHAGVREGERWFDACAGAGGKTLQLARLLNGDGAIDASDVRTGALDELRNRALRAGFRLIQSDMDGCIRLSLGRDPGVTLRIGAPGISEYDVVLLDAPCSGTGTWRRAPHLKWSTTPATVAESAALQGRLLRAHADKVRHAGRLVYATCSLCRTENLRVVERFLSERSDFCPEAPARQYGYSFDGCGTTIMPARRDSDGFYVAILRKK